MITKEKSIQLIGRTLKEYSSQIVDPKIAAHTGVAASQTVAGHMSAADKKKLDGIAEGANKYTHPSTHSLDMITETTAKKIMTADERTKLTGIESGANNYTHPASHPATMITETTDRVFMTPAEKTKLSGIAANANNYSHPSTHPASMITETTDRVFMTPAERTKLAGIQAGANGYTHPTGNGNEHVPASTTNDAGKVLKATTTAGKPVWGQVQWSEVIGKPSTFAPSTHNHNAGEISETSARIWLTPTLKDRWNNTYTQQEVDSKIAEVITSLDWKESVATFSDIAKTYPNPEDGWTVNTKDTDVTYRYDGTKWVEISANAIPVATQSVDGKMSAADKKKLDGIATGANNYVHPTGDGNLHVPANGTTNNGKFLKSGSTAGSLVWATLTWNDISGKPALATTSDLSATNNNVTALTSRVATLEGYANEVVTDEDIAAIMAIVRS